MIKGVTVEGAILALVLMMGVGVGVWACAMLLYIAVPRIVKRMGLEVHFFNAQAQTTARTDIDDVADKANDDQDGADGDDDGEKGESAGPDEQGHPRGGHLMTGKCRGCGLFHVGLTPAAIVIGPFPGQYTIQDGTPAVCPRCWCKMNPDAATNTVALPTSVATGNDARPTVGPKGGTGTPPNPPYIKHAGHGPADAPNHRGHPAVNTGEPIILDGVIQEVRKVDTKPKEMDFIKPINVDDPGAPLTGHDPTASMTEEELERATRPDAEAPKEDELKCDKCGATRVVFRPTFKDGKATGKHWCVKCVDGLGGPGEKKKRKGRRGE